MCHTIIGSEVQYRDTVIAVFLLSVSAEYSLVPQRYHSEDTLDLLHIRPNTVCLKKTGPLQLISHSLTSSFTTFTNYFWHRETLLH